MNKIEYADANKNGKTLYRFDRKTSAVIEASGYIRIINDITATTDMPIIKNIPAGVRCGTAEIKKTLDVTPAMTPEEIEAAEKAEREYRRKFAASGGKAKSPRKAAASRANGKKGGRPRNVLTPGGPSEKMWVQIPADKKLAQEISEAMAITPPPV